MSSHLPLMPPGLVTEPPDWLTDWLCGCDVKWYDGGETHRDCYLVLFAWSQSGCLVVTLQWRGPTPSTALHPHYSTMVDQDTGTQEAVVKSLTPPPPPPPLGRHTPTTQLILANTPPSDIPHILTLFCSVVSSAISKEENRPDLPHTYFSSFSDTFLQNWSTSHKFNL